MSTECADFGSERAKMSTECADFGSERAKMSTECADFSRERAQFSRESVVSAVLFSVHNFQRVTVNFGPTLPRLELVRKCVFL